MKSLRKSLQRDSSNGHFSNNSISGPLPSVSKPVAAVVPPKAVIRASADHRPTTAMELAFSKGDFFYVIREVNEGGAWYEAHNPLSGARGLVPRALFEEFSKNTAGSQRTFSTISRSSPPIPAAVVAPVLAKPKLKAYYATVLHDFVAERTDELDAKRGDTVSVVAQSNREWFVAKPIGKLGRPGLIPASFVEVRDPSTGQITDIGTIIQQNGLPSVDEWKRGMLDYKASSIALGVLDESSNTGARPAIDTPASPPMSQQSSPIMTQATPKPIAVVAPPPPPGPYAPEPQRQSQYQQEQQLQDEYLQDEYVHPQETAILPEGILVSANVVSFHFEMDEYWFRVHALFQPYDLTGSNVLPPARQLVLFRAYNDFYDFQVTLLNAFPREGGREAGFERVLPYMPGPAEDVDHDITAKRQAELDDYLVKLSSLRSSDAAYIVEHELLRGFLSPKPGDVETEVEPVAEDVLGYSEEDIDVQGMGNQMMGMNTGDPRQQQYDEYDDEEIRPSIPQNGYEQSTLRPASSGRQPSPLPPHMRPEFDRTSSGYSHGASHGRTRSGYDQDRQSAYSRSSTATDMAPKSAGSSRSSETRMRSGSAAALQSPPISANNPAPAFVKIKVFDAATDDLIAVRVHPRVTHAQLVDKISARLGVHVSSLKFRSGSNAFVGVDDDDALYDWIDTTDKLVLYAD